MNTSVTSKQIDQAYHELLNAEMCGKLDCLTSDATTTVLNTLKELSETLEREIEDSRPVTVDDMAQFKLENSSGMIGARRYEICKGLRVMFFAQVGGWGPGVLWSGSGATFIKNDLKLGELRKLVEIMRVS